MKFSEAISSICPRCRSSSFASRPAISGSTSSRPAVRSWASVYCATAILALLSGVPAGSYFRGQPTAASARAIASSHIAGAPAQDDRLGAGEVDHGRRDTRQLAAVDRGAFGAKRIRHVGETARLRAAGEVGARARHRPDLLEQRLRDPRNGRDTNADRVRIVSGQPGEAPRPVGEHERVGPGQHRRGDRASRSAELGHALEEGVEVGRDQRRRLRRSAALEPVETTHRLFVVRRRDEPVDRVGRE